MSKLIKVKIPIYIQEKIDKYVINYEKKLLKRKMTESEKDMFSLGIIQGVFFAYGNGWTLQKIWKDIKRGSK